jgi:hypothetical protein
MAGGDLGLDEVVDESGCLEPLFYDEAVVVAEEAAKAERRRSMRGRWRSARGETRHTGPSSKGSESTIPRRGKSATPDSTTRTSPDSTSTRSVCPNSSSSPHSFM